MISFMETRWSVAAAANRFLRAASSRSVVFTFGFAGRCVRDDFMVPV